MLMVYIPENHFRFQSHFHEYLSCYNYDVSAKIKTYQYNLLKDDIDTLFCYILIGKIIYYFYLKRFLLGNLIMVLLQLKPLEVLR